MVKLKSLEQNFLQNNYKVIIIMIFILHQNIVLTNYKMRQIIALQLELVNDLIERKFKDKF